MPIGPGSRVGPYEVTALLGQGGMGEVWRARHLALKRDDALKVLPDDFAGDPKRLARFQREAEILASLSHPNIAQVHGLEEVDGSSALVMELIDGLTLDDRILRGPLTLDDSLSIARQVAAALDAAHEQGIVHRDLKPSNIKVRSDGTVKVLDFGLAKAFDAARLPGASAPTEDLASLTATGIVVGTPSYMSPEQARGDPVDARADVWAFGCVLYEMLTGRRAFDGGSGSETLAAVLTRDPDWSCLPATVPPQVRTLLRRSLVRDPRHRLKHISTALFALENGDAPFASVEGTPARTWTRSWIVATTLVAAASAAVAAGALGWFSPRPGVPDVVQTIIPADTSTGTDVNFAFMPDGRLAYISRDTRAIMVRPMDVLEAVPILTTASWLRGIFPSPDGRWLAFVENAFTLKRVPAGGGPAARIVQMDGPSRGAAWGPDDAIVFATGNLETGLQQVSAAGGSPTVLTRPDAAHGELDHVQPAWLPGGRGVLFTVVTRPGVDGPRVAVFEPGAGTWRTLIEGGYAARYVGSGHLVYAATRALWAVRFDLSRLTVDGEPVEVLPNVPVGGAGVLANFDVAANGTLAFPRDAQDASSSVVPVWVDREGHETPLPVTPGAFRHPRLSADGRRLAVVLNSDIFVWDVNRPWTTASRMTFSPEADWFPVWTPDGRRIVFGSWRGGGFSNLYIQNPDGGEAERLTDSSDMQNPTSMAPDGSSVVFHSFPQRLEALRLDGRGDRQVTLVETPLEERNGVVSPDGRWLAYEAEVPTRPGFLDVFVRPFPDVTRGMWQVSGSGGTYPAWSRDGRELFYLTHDGTLMAVPVETAGGTWRNGEPLALVRGPYMYYGDGSMGRHYDVAPDGRRFLMLKTTVQSNPHFVVIQNWAAQLNRLTDGR